MTEDALPPPGPSTIRKLGATAAVLAGVAALGQAFVVLREVYVAAGAGTSASLDALLVALVAPSIAVSLLSSSTQAALVPALIEVDAHRGRDAARRLAGVIVASVLGVAVLVALLIWLFAEAAIAVSGPGLSPASRETARDFVPILLPLVVLAPAGILLAAVGQVHGMFRAISASWVAGPVVALAVTVILWQSLGVTALALATTADAVATVVVLVVALAWRRHLPWPGRGVQRADVARFVQHAAPLAAGSSVLQLNLLADRAVASLFSTGAVSALRYGERIIRAPVSVLLPGWSTAVYPTIARSVGDEDRSAMGRTAAESLRFVIAVFMPLSVATAALAPVLVAFAYQRGAFDASATVTTAAVVAAFAPLILLWLVHPILNAAHNARRRGGLLARNAMLNAASNLALNLLFGSIMGVAGVALSTSVTGWTMVTILAIQLRNREPDFDLRGVARVAMKALGASLVPAIPIGFVAWIVRPTLDLGGQFLFLAGATLIGATTYLWIARALGVREPWIALRATLQAARRRSSTGT
jgi:putative peptidoglycan lipid II flippase